MTFEVVLQEDAANSLHTLDASAKERLLKRIARMRHEPAGRHMQHGFGFFVEEAGQYRIVYTCEGNKKIIYFVGDHKAYEKWYLGKK